MFSETQRTITSLNPQIFTTEKVIYEALTLITQKPNLPLEDKFIITGDSIIIPDKK